MCSYQVFVFWVVLLGSVIMTVGILPFSGCSKLPPSPEVRELFVATCDTRAGWKEFMAMKTWNVTGHDLRTIHKVSMINVCKTRAWKGFLTKPTLYLAWLNTLPVKSRLGGDSHVLLMDADTFWATSDLSKIWSKYDCARGHRNLLLSTEMSCWVGRYCTINDLHYYYNHTDQTPSYSPFVNSGIVMGRIQEVKEMLEYVIENNQSYYTTYFKRKFDDQFAYTDYALKIKPEKVALDYHQQLLASFSVHAPGDPFEIGWPFACRAHETDKRWDHQLCPSCPNWTVRLNRFGHFQTNQDTCDVHRKFWKGMPLEEQMHTLASDPVIWHGNGVGKRSYYQHAHSSYVCRLKARNFTVKSYENTQCC